MITVKDIIKKIEELAPLSLSEAWDNSGLQIGVYNQPVKNIMLALDITREIIEEAIDKNIDFIISHHPFIFNPIKSITSEDITGNMILKLIANNISVYSSHTCLDITQNGLNDLFASLIGLNKTTILKEIPYDVCSVESAGRKTGIGRIGELEKEITLEQLMKLLKEKLNLTSLRYTGEKNDYVKKIAICTGSGGELIDSCLEKKADVYITGDLKYHESRIAYNFGLKLIDAGHYETEIIFSEYLADYIRNSFVNENIEVFKSEKSKPVFKYL